MQYLARGLLLEGLLKNHRCRYCGVQRLDRRERESSIPCHIGADRPRSTATFIPMRIAALVRQSQSLMVSVACGDVSEKGISSLRSTGARSPVRHSTRKAGGIHRRRWHDDLGVVDPRSADEADASACTEGFRDPDDRPVLPGSCSLARTTMGPFANSNNLPKLRCDDTTRAITPWRGITLLNLPKCGLIQHVGRARRAHVFHRYI